MKMQLVGLSVLGFTALSSIAGAAESQTVDLAVTEKGFEPSSLDAKAGSDVTLSVTRTTDNTCATQLQVGTKTKKIDLPLNKPVLVKLGKLEKGEVKFACGMGMLSGVVVAK